ncbi:TOBE domain-containing protein, partial [Rhodovulum sp. 12E13]|uniref:TOBE domain-containing protein n=1 Tax=Rhodovulum sp. 12E13 TaxID=2203891 RepID=UPI000E1AAB45
LADKIVVLRGGRVEQVGSPMQLYDDPDNRFVAGFIGSPSMNFFAGTVEAGGVRVAGLGGRHVETHVDLPAHGSEVTVGLRPGHLKIDPAAATHEVDLTEALGGVSYVYLIANNGDRIVLEAHENDPLPQGGRVGVTLAPADTYLFDASSGLRLR